MQQDDKDFNDKMKDIANSLSNESIEQLISYYENNSNNVNNNLNNVIDENKNIVNNIVNNKELIENKLNQVENESKEDQTNQNKVQQNNSLKLPKVKIPIEEGPEVIENKEELIKEKENDIKQIKEAQTKTEELQKEINEKKEKLEEGLIELNNIENSIMEEKDPFVETKTEKDAINAMELIATNTSYSSGLLDYTDPKVSENQFKLFIIAQCKRELYKILEYSKMLDKLEARFKEVYIDRLDELSDGMIVSLMQIVLEKIDRGNELINSVIKDKDITNVLIINQQNNMVNSISDLTKDKLLQTLYKSSEAKAESPAASRAKVIEVVTNILKDEAVEDNEDVNTEEELINDIEEINNEEVEVVKQDNRTEIQKVNDDIDKKLAEIQRQKNMNQQGG